MAKFVDAVNDRNEKVRIPARWIGHPVLGKGFRLAPSERARSGRSTPPASTTPVAGSQPESTNTDETPAAGAKE